MKNLFKKTSRFGFVFVFLFFAETTFVNAQQKDKDEKVYVKIEVNGMACAYCAYGMEQKLKKVSGIDNVAIELEEGMAYISTLKSQKPEKESLSLIIQNAGFTPGSIEYSDQPFLKEEKSKK